MSTLDRLDGVVHGSQAGFDAGCRSQGGCPNHGSRTELTCFEAAQARRGNYAISKLPAATPITRAMIAIPKAKPAIAAPQAPAPGPTPANAAQPAQKAAAPAKRSAPKNAVIPAPPPRTEPPVTAREASRVQPQKQPAPAPEPLRIDSADTVAHLRQLRATGATLAELADEAGLSENTLARLAARNPTPLVRASTAQKILAVTAERAAQIHPPRPKPQPRPTTVRVGVEAAAAHIRDLGARGVPAAHVARAARVSYELVLRIINDRVETIEESKAQRILAVTTAAKRERKRPPEVHGTVFGWRRGCRKDEACPNHGTDRPTCLAAHSSYYRDYRRARAAGAGPEIHHGTTTGYQMGCRDRASCPGGPDGRTCSDAAADADRERRRRAGRPEARPTIPSKPAVDHIRALREAGMSINEIAVAAGCGRTAIRMLVYGRDDYANGRKGPRHGKIPAHIEADKAARILAIQAPATSLHERKAS